MAMNTGKARKYLGMVRRAKGSTYRQRWCRKYGIKFKSRGTKGYAHDAAISLQEHDERYHNGHYEDGQRCNLRAVLAKADGADIVGEKKGKTVQSPWITPEMDAEYAEAFDAMEEAEENGDTVRKSNMLNLMREMVESHAHLAFVDTDMALKDFDTDMPKVLYHGTTKGGFTVFDCDGEGKTEGTGAWFSDDEDNAYTYGGSHKDYEQPPRINAKYLREEGYLTDAWGVVDEEGNVIDVDYGCRNEEEAKEKIPAEYFKLQDIYNAYGKVSEMSYNEFKHRLLMGLAINQYSAEINDWDAAYNVFPDLKETLENAKKKLRHAKVSVVRTSYDEELFPDEDSAVDYAKQNVTEFYDNDNQECIYSVYVNAQVNTYDAEGNSWDNIPEAYQVVDDETGEDARDYWGDKEEAEEFIENLKNENPGKTYSLRYVTTTTDAKAREIRGYGDGRGGVVIENVSDCGGYGGCLRETNDYIIFKPNLIKMTDPITFDDYGNLIPLSKRFDFTNPDIRY